MSLQFYLCYLTLLTGVIQVMVTADETADDTTNDLSHMSEGRMDKKASFKYVGVGKRTVPPQLLDSFKDSLDLDDQKRASQSLKYASLGKRETADLLDYLSKRVSSFKYGSLGKRAQDSQMESGLKRGSFRYGSLGKRGNSAFRYSSLGKRGNSAFRYSSLGKRDLPNSFESDSVIHETPSQSHHKLEKRSTSLGDHDILAKRLGYAYKYASVGKRIPVPEEIHKRWSNSHSQQNAPRDPFKRRAATYRYIGVGKRNNPGIKYASLGKRQSQWKYAGLGKRSVSEDRLNELIGEYLDQSLNSVELPDERYINLESMEPFEDVDEWSDWQ